MRIMIVANGAHTPGAWTNRWLIPGLISAGHRPIACDPSLLAGLLGVSQAQSVLVAAAKVHQPHLIITNPPYDLVFPATAQAWKDLGTRPLGWRTDDPGFIADLATGPAAAEAAMTAAQSRYTLVGTGSRLGYDYLRRQGCTNLAYLPMMLSEIPDGGYTLTAAFDCTFVGSGYARTADATAARHALLNDVARAGIPLQVFGHGWETVSGVDSSGFVPEEALNPLFRRSTVNLAVDQWRRATMGWRPLQIALAGGLVVAGPCPDLADYFEPDKEIVIVRNQADLHDRLKSLLAAPQEAAAIASAGQRRAQRDHTFAKGWPMVQAAVETIWQRPLDPGTVPTGADPVALATLITANSALAHMLEARQRHEEAIYLFKDILGLVPTDFGARTGLARMLERLGQKQDAMKLWVHAASLVEPIGYGQDMRLNVLPSSALITPEQLEPRLGALIEAQRLAAELKDAPTFLYTLPMLLPYYFDSILAFAEGLLADKPRPDEQAFVAAIVTHLYEQHDRYPQAKDRLFNLRRKLSYGTP
ncbi:MAG: glycosyltransferase [Candidatus Sericytochromatia bacterium]|nr:glycosyltransferase [Candidatus Sericytochromatia bacterium]